MIVEIMNRIVEQEENIGLRPHFPLWALRRPETQTDFGF